MQKINKDILSLIIKLLPIKSVINLSLTCKRLDGLCKLQQFWTKRLRDEFNFNYVDKVNFKAPSRSALHYYYLLISEPRVWEIIWFNNEAGASSSIINKDLKMKGRKREYYYGIICECISFGYEDLMEFVIDDIGKVDLSFIKMACDLQRANMLLTLCGHIDSYESKSQINTMRHLIISIIKNNIPVTTKNTLLNIILGVQTAYAKDGFMYVFEAAFKHMNLVSLETLQILKDFCVTHGIRVSTTNDRSSLIDDLLELNNVEVLPIFYPDARKRTGHSFHYNYELIKSYMNDNVEYFKFFGNLSKYETDFHIDSDYSHWKCDRSFGKNLSLAANDPRINRKTDYLPHFIKYYVYDIMDKTKVNMFKYFVTFPGVLKFFKNSDARKSYEAEFQVLMNSLPKEKTIGILNILANTNNYISNFFAAYME